MAADERPARTSARHHHPCRSVIFHHSSHDIHLTTTRLGSTPSTFAPVSRSKASVRSMTATGLSPLRPSGGGGRVAVSP